MTAMKLQKLLFYAQAWSLVWDEKPLFAARIEAWANGPVIPRVYLHHKGCFKVKPGQFPGNARALVGRERETIDAVLKHYGHRTSQWLSDLSHVERPWRDARRELQPGERGNAEISLASMAEYYGSL